MDLYNVEAWEHRRHSNSALLPGIRDEEGRVAVGGELAGGVERGLAVAGREGGDGRIVPDIVPVGGVSATTRHRYHVLLICKIKQMEGRIWHTFNAERFFSLLQVCSLQLCWLLANTRGRGQGRLNNIWQNFLFSSVLYHLQSYCKKPENCGTNYQLNCHDFTYTVK